MGASDAAQERGGGKWGDKHTHREREGEGQRDTRTGREKETRRGRERGGEREGGREEERVRGCAERGRGERERARPPSRLGPNGTEVLSHIDRLCLGDSRMSYMVKKDSTDRQEYLPPTLQQLQDLDNNTLPTTNHPHVRMCMRTQCEHECKWVCVVFFWGGSWRCVGV